MENKTRFIILSKIGYNAPSQANWCYGVWKVDFIDLSKNVSWLPSVVVIENFGGDSRFKKEVLEQTKQEVLESTGVYTKTGTPKITGIRGLQSLDSDKFIKEVVDFLNFNDLK